MVGNIIYILIFLLGNYSVTMPFKNILEEDNFEEKLIWVKQCRLHYLFATKRNAHELFENKEIEFNLFITRKEHMFTQGSNKLRKSATTSSLLKPPHRGSAGLQWEGSFKVSFHQLKWLTCPDADNGLLEKVDLLVPITTNTMGTMVLKLSLALEFNSFVPFKATDYNFLKENSVFWPPTVYNDGCPLPSAWLALMTVERNINKYNQRKTADVKHFYKADADDGSPLNRHKPMFRADSFHAEQERIENEEAAEGGAVSIDIEKFNRISTLIPFIGRVFERQQEMHSHGEVLTVTALYAISDALVACTVDPALLVSSATHEEIALRGRPENHHETVDAIESLQGAINEMMIDDQVPGTISWGEFLEKIAVFVGTVLKKEARNKIVQDVQTKLEVMPSQNDKYGDKSRGMDNILNHFKWYSNKS